MLVFITSLRARVLAKDWDYHVWMLDRTLHSVLAQNAGSMRAVVACHDLPESAFLKDPRVHFLPVGFSPPERNFDDMCADKVLKLSVGAQWAVDQGCDYVMFGDADDLVSNRIGALVESNKGAPGWYSGHTYFYCYGSRLLRLFRVPDPTSLPSVIVRSDLLSFDAPPFSGRWSEMIKQAGELSYLAQVGRHGASVNTLAAVGLANYRTFLAAEGHHLEAVPFAPMIMVNHIESTSHVPGGVGSYHQDGPVRPAWRTFLSRIKFHLAMLPSMRLVTPTLRQEFSIPPDSEIPERYRSRGSLFWR